MANTLELGTQRIGQLVDFDEDTPVVTVTLARNERGISLRVPWTSRQDPYRRWFYNPTANDVRPVPPTLQFLDLHGSVVLIGCRARGFESNPHEGVGHVWAQYAVLGSRRPEFARPHGLRSEVSGLFE